MLLGKSIIHAQNSATPIYYVKSDSVPAAPKKQGLMGFFRKMLGMNKHDMSSGSSKNNKKDTTKTHSLHNSSAAKKDSTKSFHQGLFSKLDNLSAHGSISAGYDYGVLPFASDFQVPMGYFHGEGQTQFNLATLPFNGSFYYSDIKNISGLNNYFRVAFDAEKFRQNYIDKEARQEQNLKNELGNLYKGRQSAEQKLLYLTSIQNQGSVKAPGTSVPSSNVVGKDENSIEKSLSSDSLTKVKAPPTSQSDSAAKAGNKSHSPNSIVRNADSVKADIQKYQKQIAAYDKDIDKTTRELNGLNNDSKLKEHNDPYMGSLYNLMSGVKKLEVGLCYPDYSTFLVSGMAIKGINLEYQKSEIYVAATEGNTVNTLLFTNNSLQNHLVNMQNLYNMFDFQSVQNGRKIFAVKTGWGEKEGTHLYVGMLYGSGLPSYLNTNIPVSQSGISKNYVLELDGKWAVTKKSSFNLVYGKSSTQTQGGEYDATDGGVLNSKRSKAIMGKYDLNLPQTKTKITITSRWVDPYFNSFGVGYIRADNFRYEIKAEQPFCNKVKVTVFYRKDEDDILDLYQYHTILQTIGTNVTIKLKRSLTLRIGYTPVVEHMWGDNPTYNIFNNNNICNLVLSYTPIIKDVYVVFNTSYNYYRLTTDSETIAFQNFTFSNMVRLKNSVSNNVSISWFKTAPTDSLNNNVWMLEDEVGYTFRKGLLVKVGGKAAWSPLTKTWQTGYLMKMEIPLIKHLSCELTGEKLVIGDFYNSFDILQIKKFPYYCQGRIILSW